MDNKVKGKFVLILFCLTYALIFFFLPYFYDYCQGELFQYDMSKLMNHIKLMTSVLNEVPRASNSGDGGDADEAGTTDVGRYPRNANVPWSDGPMIAATSSPDVPPPPWLTNVEGDGPEADKDNLLRNIFILLDKNHDSILEYVELYKVSFIL